MLGLTVAALGALTAGVGTVLDSQAAAADASQVASDLDAALDERAHGYHSGRVRFSEGSLSTADRTVRVLRNGSVVGAVDAGALVFESGDRRAAYIMGAVVRGRGGGAWLTEPPSVTSSGRNDVLVVGVPRLGADEAGVGGTGGAAVTLETNVTHSRADLGRGEFAVAVETTTPDPLARHFREANATVTRRDFDGDGTPSVVARYPGRRQGYLVVHDLALEVGDG